MLHFDWLILGVFDLLHSVQKNDDLLGPKRLVTMAQGVAAGMQYFGEIGFVHRVSLINMIPRCYSFLPPIKQL